MNIGIITQPLLVNYGGLLQAYALESVLNQLGHKAVILDEDLFSVPKRRVIKRLLELGIKKYILRDKGIDFHGKEKEKAIFEIESKRISYFVNNQIVKRQYIGKYTLSSKEFDAIIVGSDQVWRPKYNFPIEDSFLKFAKHWNIKRIAYAASFGTDKWEYSEKQTKNCRQLVQKFNAVSVREESGIALCKEYLDVDAVLVLDPTLLLAKDDYIQIFKSNNTPKSNGNLLSYILDPTTEKTALINDISSQKALNPFYVNKKLEDGSFPSVESWLRGFYDAEYVITDSFHACVFSIIFNKQFAVVPNHERGVSRLLSLFNTLGTGNRMVASYSDLTKLPAIDYSMVNSNLEKWKEKSISFLKKNLSV